jgi:exopolysaccharide biosynthesis polyprenyl glycosylphosphotransferase
MLRRFSTDFAIFMMVIDAILIGLCLKLALLTRPYLSHAIRQVKQLQGPFQVELSLYLIFPLIWVVILVLFSAYDARKNLKINDELNSVTLGSIIAAVSLAGMLYLSFRDISRALFGSFVLFTFFSLIIIRVFYRLAFRAGIGGVQQRRVLIIGAGLVGRQVEKNIRQYKNLGFHMVGYLDDDPAKQTQSLVVGSLDEVRQVIIREYVDDVVLALPLRAYHRSNQLVTELHDMPVRVWVVPDYFALTLSHARIDELAGLPMIDLRAPTLNDYQRMVKRGFDLIVSIILLPVVLIIIAIISIAIRLDSPGPAIFRQKRVGENGRLFEMVKFRTMVADAEHNHHMIEKIDENGRILQDKTVYDPRITRIGRILRKTSLDELPQLFNVLRGEMSLVGPRPELPYLVDQYEPWQRGRFSVPQGMTGWWQVNGRSNKPMHLNTQDDLYYVQNYSIWLDIVIILRTAWNVFRRRGAY